MEKECSFSFYKITTYPFFLLLSPLQSRSIVFSFFLYLFYFIRPHSFINVFFHSFCRCLRSIFYVCLRVLCMKGLSFTMYVSVYNLFVLSWSETYFLLQTVFLLLLLMSAVKIGLKRMIKTFSLLLKCICVFIK